MGFLPSKTRYRLATTEIYDNKFSRHDISQFLDYVILMWCPDGSVVRVLGCSKERSRFKSHWRQRDLYCVLMLDTRMIAEHIGSYPVLKSIVTAMNEVLLPISRP